MNIFFIEWLLVSHAKTCRVRDCQRYRIFKYLYLDCEKKKKKKEKKEESELQKVAKISFKILKTFLFMFMIKIGNS